jgi:hypothetical protein
MKLLIPVGFQVMDSHFSRLERRVMWVSMSLPAVLEVENKAVDDAV